MAEMHRDLAADLSDPEGPFGLPSPRENQIWRRRQRKSNTRKSRSSSAWNKASGSSPITCPRTSSLVEVYRGWDDEANLGQPRAGCWRDSPTTLKPSRFWRRHYFEEDDPAAALPLVQTGAHDQAARRVTPRAGVEHPGPPGPRSRPRQELGPGPRAVHGRRRTDARPPQRVLFTWPAGSSSRPRPARPSKAIAISNGRRPV